MSLKQVIIVIINF